MIKLTGATNHPATETPDLACYAFKLRLCSSFEYSFQLFLARSARETKFEKETFSKSQGQLPAAR